jgi:hypothetical protein
VLIAQTHSYRHAEAILEVEYPEHTREIREVLAIVNWQPKKDKKSRVRGGRVVATLDIDQIATNAAIEKEFEERGWTPRPMIVSHAESRLAADFKKGPVQVEVQFGNMARWYTDVFKFLLSYAADDIEVGVLVVPMQDAAKRIDENIAYFERVVRELPHAKMAITIPVWVVGVE